MEVPGGLKALELNAVLAFARDPNGRVAYELPEPERKLSIGTSVVN